MQAFVRISSVVSMLLMLVALAHLVVGCKLIERVSIGVESRGWELFYLGCDDHFITNTTLLRPLACQAGQFLMQIDPHKDANTPIQASDSSPW